MRKFGRMGLYRRDAATGQPAAGEAAGVLAPGAEPLVRRLHGAAFRRDARPAPRPPQDAAAEPGLPRRRRQHLRRRGSVAGAAPPAARCRRRFAPRMRAGSTGPCATSWPRRSSGGAARSTTTRRPKATARCRSICRSTSEPASRATAAAGRSGGSSGRAIDPLLLAGASGSRRGSARRRRSCCDGTSGTGRRAPPRPTRRGEARAGPSSPARAPWAGPRTRRPGPARGLRPRAGERARRAAAAREAPPRRRAAARAGGTA